MKKHITIFLTLCTVWTVCSQNFEGKITYFNSYKSNNPQVTDQQWNTMLGSTQEYYIKSGDYKSVVNGSLFQWQLYRNDANKLYNKMANSEIAFWNDGAIQGDEVLKVVWNKKTSTVLGYLCDELILTCKSGVQKYYFNSKIKVDAALFAKHKFGNWFDFVSKSNAIPLKTIIETPQFTLVSTATAVLPMVLESSFFQLPVGILTEKSPY
ncbi:hypothetical protein [Flavobacterium restrictum]|uniref:GLPGLI family protein n=1 Tax=Flavobacterium restrictum TaxID=2594428 RepID=A0A553ECL6_9FLAO|nr:hypothetical protein [Flavobacterium restrictum]TRX42800.1 hypothetical protein FNW21_00265 [Flavobacterium restrictum]